MPHESVVILSDAKEVINVIKSGEDWKILHDICGTVKSFLNVEFCFIPKAFNGQLIFGYV